MSRKASIALKIVAGLIIVVFVLILHQYGQGEYEEISTQEMWDARHPKQPAWMEQPKFPLRTIFYNIKDSVSKEDLCNGFLKKADFFLELFRSDYSNSTDALDVFKGLEEECAETIALHKQTLDTDNEGP